MTASSQYEDKTIKCIDIHVNKDRCEVEFVFTAGEQEFYASKDFSPPRRCPFCRAAKKQKFND